MRAPFIIVAAALCLSAPARAYDVTTPEARKLTLLEYVAGRDDLAKADKATWDKALRVAFGGKAIKDGTDEGVTVAKSVIAAAIFYGIEPSKAAKAAYDAYHDTYRWVPPPIAINYQILAFQGRKPKATARQLAFNFPRYFNEEIAPDLATWWEEMLASGRIPPQEVSEVTRVLAETRALMRPMLRDRLWQGAELEARLVGRASNDPALAELLRNLEQVRADVARDFRNVGKKPVIGDHKALFYDRYKAVTAELGQTALPKPQYNLGRAPQAKAVPQPPPERPAPTPAPEPERAPKAVEPKAPEPARPAEERPAPTVKPPQTASQRPAENREDKPGARATAEDGFVAQPREDVERERRRGQELTPAPLPGDPLVALFSGWKNALDGTVEAWVGTPYLFGGMDRRGIDCSAFVQRVFRDSLGVDLPRNSRAQFALGRKVEQTTLKPGDMIFFDTLDRGQVTHVGVYLGEGQFAHASSSKGVTRAGLAAKYYQRAYWGGKRILSN